MMNDRDLEDDLVQRLAQSSEESSRELDPALAAINADIDSLSEALKIPPKVNPFASEPELANTIDVASKLAHETLPEPAKPDLSSTGAAKERGPVFLGQYELQKKLGSGGMGTVYRAVHRKLNRTVAVKVLPPDRLQTVAAVARFEREMQAVGMLQHPNIVAAHDAGEVDGRHFLVMEYVDGIDIAHLASQTEPLPIADACEIVRQAALGLQHIADHGLVHRDIKPSNLMLAAPRNGAPMVKILDLGLALLEPDQPVADSPLTSTGQVMGTIDYMAPEQGLDTHHVDIRADLYSLGATLYKLLTGRAPLQDPKYNSVMKLMIALERDQPPRLTSLRPECPVELCDFIHRLLSKSPTDRPKSPQAVADILTPYAKGADLRALLQGIGQSQKRVNVANLVVPTITATPHQLRSATAGATGRRSWRWLSAAALPLVLLFGVVLYVVTDNGTVTIEAPTDLQESLAISVLRNGTPAVENWIIKPGVNEHRIRTGAVEVRLSADASDAFELQSPSELVVRRGGEVVYHLRRRSSPLPDLQPPPPTPMRNPPWPTSPDDLPAGFTSLFNGKDLRGWKAAVEDPKKRAGMTPDELDQAQKVADQQLSSHWRISNGILICDGHGHNLSTVKDYTDFELYLEWKIGAGGDSGVYLRGAPQVQICDSAVSKWGKDEGSGGLFNNKKHTSKPLVNADKPVGEWNAMFIRMVGAKVTVSLNGKLVVDNIVYENFVEPEKPIYPSGPIELQRYGRPVEFRSLWIRELTFPLPSTTGKSSPWAPQSPAVEPVALPTTGVGGLDCLHNGSETLAFRRSL